MSANPAGEGGERGHRRVVDHGQLGQLVGSELAAPIEQRYRRAPYGRPVDHEALKQGSYSQLKAISEA